MVCIYTLYTGIMEERERAGRKDVDKYEILFKAFQCLGKGNLGIDKSIPDPENV